MVRNCARSALLLLGVCLVVAGCGSTEEVSGQAASSSSDAKFKELYDEVAKLEGDQALEFFQSLPEKGVTDTEVIDFFVDLPLSQANTQIYDLFQDEGFQRYLEGYPRGEPHEGFQWEQGSGTEISGPGSVRCSV